MTRAVASNIRTSRPNRACRWLPLLLNAQRLADRRAHECRVADRGKVDEVHAVLEHVAQLQRCLDSEPGLARAGRACKGQKAYFGEQQLQAHRIELASPADEAR